MSMILEGSVSRARQLAGANDLLGAAFVYSSPGNSDQNQDHTLPERTSMCGEGSCEIVVEQPAIDGVLEMIRGRGLGFTRRDWATLIALGAISQGSNFNSEEYKLPPGHVIAHGHSRRLQTIRKGGL